MNDIVLHKQDLDELAEVGQLLVSSGMFKDSQKVAQAAVKVLAGRELGLGPVESMRSFHIVEGKVEMSADLLAQRVKAHPKYDYRVLVISDMACAIEFFEDGASLGVSEFSMDDARTAGLGKSSSGKPSAWQTYPRNMLFARAMSNGVAWYCPDAAGTARIYVDGEIGGETIDVEGQTVDIATGEIVEDGAMVSGESPEQLDPSAHETASPSTSEPRPSGDGEAPGGLGLPQRFWDKVVVDPDTGCWLWTGALRSGYGAYGEGNSKVHRAHRLTYEAVYGPVLDGLELDHLCETKRCVRATHMEAVTHAENLRRRPDREGHVPVPADQSPASPGEGDDSTETASTPTPSSGAGDPKLALYTQLVSLCADRDVTVTATLAKALGRAVKAKDVPEKITEDEMRTAIDSLAVPA